MYRTLKILLGVQIVEVTCKMNWEKIDNFDTTPTYKSLIEIYIAVLTKENHPKQVWAETQLLKIGALLDQLKLEREVAK